MDVVYEQKRGPVFVLFFNLGGEVEAPSARAPRMTMRQGLQSLRSKT